MKEYYATLLDCLSKEIKSPIMVRKSYSVEHDNAPALKCIKSMANKNELNKVFIHHFSYVLVMFHSEFQLISNLKRGRYLSPGEDIEVKRGCGMRK